MRYATLYSMIKSWKHKGLKRFYETGSTSGIQAKHESRLKIILQRLDAAFRPEDMDLPGMRFHKLSGKLKEHFAVSVNGNWRVIYKFDGGHALLVDYLDYH
jgi:toxin HigB-1